MIDDPLFTKEEEQEHARDWLEQSPTTGFVEVVLTPDTLTINITQEAKDLLNHLKEQGIEYEPPSLVLCG